MKRILIIVGNLVNPYCWFMFTVWNFVDDDRESRQTSDSFPCQEAAADG